MEIVDSQYQFVLKKQNLKKFTIFFIVFLIVLCIIFKSVIQSFLNQGCPVNRTCSYVKCVFIQEIVSPPVFYGEDIKGLRGR